MSRIGTYTSLFQHQHQLNTISPCSLLKHIPKVYVFVSITKYKLQRLIGDYIYEHKWKLRFLLNGEGEYRPCDIYLRNDQLTLKYYYNGCDFGIIYKLGGLTIIATNLKRSAYISGCFSTGWFTLGLVLRELLDDLLEEFKEKRSFVIMIDYFKRVMNEAIRSLNCFKNHVH